MCLTWNADRGAIPAKESSRLIVTPVEAIGYVSEDMIQPRFLMSVPVARRAGQQGWARRDFCSVFKFVHSCRIHKGMPSHSTSSGAETLRSREYEEGVHQEDSR